MMKMTQSTPESLKVAVLAGGLSHERDVSIRSGRRVADALRSTGVQVQVFKRRGPPMDRPLTLAAEWPVMACLRRWPLPPLAPVAPARPHVVDRPVAQPRHAFA